MSRNQPQVPSQKWTPQEEAAFDAKVERHFRSQRELQRGRDYRWNTFRYITDEELELMREHYDLIFPQAPGNREWFDARFCPKCRRRKTLCRCES